MYRGTNWSGREFGWLNYFFFFFTPFSFHPLKYDIKLNIFLAGFLAREMGFPIKLVATVNSNDILARTFQKGDYSPAADVAASIAPAMDIQVTW